MKWIKLYEEHINLYGLDFDIELSKIKGYSGPLFYKRKRTLG